MTLLADASTAEFWAVVGPWAATCVGMLVLAALGWVVREMRNIRTDLEKQIETTNTRVEDIYLTVKSEYVKKDTVEIRLDAVIDRLAGLKHGQEAQAKEVREIRDRVIRCEASH